VGSSCSPSYLKPLASRPAVYRNPHGSSSSTSSDGAGVAEDMDIYEGTVMSFVVEKHWGFISSPQLFEHGVIETPDKGIFFHGKDVVAGRALSKGESVTFQLTLSPGGKPQAVYITSMNPQDSVSSAGGGGLTEGLGLGLGAPELAILGLQAIGSDQRFEGTVMSFVQDKHWGFIRCTAVYELGLLDGPDRGIFFHGKDIIGGNPPSKGETVSFQLSTNDNLKLQAVSVTSLGGGAPQSNSPMGKGGGWGKTPAPQTGQRMTGTIQSFNEQKAWGFLSAPDLEGILPPGMGVFFHIKDFVTGPSGALPRPGLAVSFAHYMAPSGKYQANQVTPIDDAGGADGGGWGAQSYSQSPSPSKGGWNAPSKGNWASQMASTQMAQMSDLGASYEGTIQSYNQEKVWGFISSPALEPVLGPGTGIFFHLKDTVGFGGGQPQSGMAVTFTYTIDSSGKPHANNVQPGAQQEASEADTGVTPDMFTAFGASMGGSKRGFDAQDWSMSGSFSSMAEDGAKRMRWG